MLFYKNVPGLLSSVSVTFTHEWCEWVGMSEIVKTNPGSHLCDTVIQVSISVNYIHCILYRPVQVFEFQINVDGVGALLPVLFCLFAFLFALLVPVVRFPICRCVCFLCFSILLLCWIALVVCFARSTEFLPSALSGVGWGCEEKVLNLNNLDNCVLKS